jgi:hypothetical protein
MGTGREILVNKGIKSSTNTTHADNRAAPAQTSASSHGMRVALVRCQTLKEKHGNGNSPVWLYN